MCYIFIISFFFLACGCQNDISKKVINRIQYQCGDKPNCIIKISDATDFIWDKMYVFKTSASLEEINKALGFYYPYYHDIARRVIFTQGTKVVYHEDDFPYSDERSAGRVLFTFKEDTLDFMVFKINEAVFNAKREGSGKDVFYELSPIN